MDADQLKKNVGQKLYLRPHPLSAQYFPRTIAVLTSGGDPMVARRVAQADYGWRLMAVTSNSVTLHCLQTNHKITLGADSVLEFRTPHFLLLQYQLTLDGDAVHIEPIP